MSLLNTKDKQEFIKTFHSIARHKHRYEVFRDFVTMVAISLHNAVNKSEELEAEYMAIVGHYSKEELNQIAKLLACLIELLEVEPADVLGQLYMELEFGNEHMAQFFTPPELSKMISAMLYGEDLESLKKPFITLSEPACGAGGMVLAFVDQMLAKGLNPATCLWVQCIDIDRLAGMMCYVQLTLWHVPAQIIIGNTLSLEFREQFFTPAYYLHGWREILKFRDIVERIKEFETPDDEAEKPEKGEQKRFSDQSLQIDIFDLV